tara:strand:- start:90 stop:317 length:228 start_codon:yes stop_codon:yes gene_type:complete
MVINKPKDRPAQVWLKQRRAGRLSFPVSAAFAHHTTNSLSEAIILVKLGDKQDKQMLDKRFIGVRIIEIWERSCR